MDEKSLAEVLASPESFAGVELDKVTQNYIPSNFQLYLDPQREGNAPYNEFSSSWYFAEVVEYDWQSMSETNRGPCCFHLGRYNTGGISYFHCYLFTPENKVYKKCSIALSDITAIDTIAGSDGMKFTILYNIAWIEGEPMVGKGKMYIDLKTPAYYDSKNKSQVQKYSREPNLMRRYLDRDFRRFWTGISDPLEKVMKNWDPSPSQATGSVNLERGVSKEGMRKRRSGEGGGGGAAIAAPPITDTGDGTGEADTHAHAAAHAAGHEKVDRRSRRKSSRRKSIRRKSIRRKTSRRRSIRRKSTRRKSTRRKSTRRKSLR